MSNREKIDALQLELDLLKVTVDSTFKLVCELNDALAEANAKLDTVTALLLAGAPHRQQPQERQRRRG